MKLPTTISLSLAFLTGIFLVTPALATVNIGYVTVGNGGNANDTTGYGAVANTYQIAQNETTISQYAKFLNQKAKADPTGLYSTSMGSDGNIAGITRSGVDGTYSYSVSGSGNRPIASREDVVLPFDLLLFHPFSSSSPKEGGHSCPSSQ